MRKTSSGAAARLKSGTHAVERLLGIEDLPHRA